MSGKELHGDAGIFLLQEALLRLPSKDQKLDRGRHLGIYIVLVHA